MQTERILCIECVDSSSGPRLSKKLYPVGHAIYSFWCHFRQRLRSWASPKPRCGYLELVGLVTHPESRLISLEPRNLPAFAEHQSDLIPVKPESDVSLYRLEMRFKHHLQVSRSQPRVVGRKHLAVYLNGQFPVSVQQLNVLKLLWPI